MVYKPETYRDLAPYLLVRDVEAALAFAETAFAATRLREFRNGSGVVVHAEARIGDSTVMIGRTADPLRAHVHLYIPDPDAAMTRALDAGAVRTNGMIETADGARRGAVRDPQGITWWLARQMERPA